MVGGVGGQRRYGPVAGAEGGAVRLPGQRHGDRAGGGQRADGLDLQRKEIVEAVEEDRPTGPALGCRAQRRDGAGGQALGVVAPEPVQPVVVGGDEVAELAVAGRQRLPQRLRPHAGAAELAEQRARRRGEARRGGRSARTRAARRRARPRRPRARAPPARAAAPSTPTAVAISRTSDPNGTTLPPTSAAVAAPARAGSGRRRRPAARPAAASGRRRRGTGAAPRRPWRRWRVR